jgi:hypothetical protein
VGAGDAVIDWPAIKAALLSQLGPVCGSSHTFGYEPTAIDPPCLYLLLDNWEHSQAGQVTVNRYRVLARVCIRWVDFEQAELELDPYPALIAAAIDADRHLGFMGGGAPHATVQGGPAVFVTIGKVTYRAFDVSIDVLENH